MYRLSTCRRQTTTQIIGSNCFIKKRTNRVCPSRLWLIIAGEELRSRNYYVRNCTHTLELLFDNKNCLQVGNDKLHNNAIFGTFTAIKHVVDGIDGMRGMWAVCSRFWTRTASLKGGSYPDSTCNIAFNFLHSTCNTVSPLFITRLLYNCQRHQGPRQVYNLYFATDGTYYSIPIIFAYY